MSTVRTTGATFAHAHDPFGEHVGVLFHDVAVRHVRREAGVECVGGFYQVEMVHLHRHVCPIKPFGGRCCSSVKVQWHAATLAGAWNASGECTVAGTTFALATVAPKTAKNLQDHANDYCLRAESHPSI
jgi:hypothetical protein